MLPSISLIIFILTDRIKTFSTLNHTEENHMEGSPRVVGGFTCTPDSYPFLVSIYAQSNLVWCGGSLLSKRFVLTSGHCCTRKDLSIEAGSSQARRSMIQKSKVIRTVIHPNFISDGKVENDLCVIQLKTPIEANDVVSYMSLANTSYFEELMREQKCNYSLVLGFGYQGGRFVDNTPMVESPPYDKHLQCLYMTPVSEEECNLFFPGKINAFCAKDSRNMMQGDTCLGDSGGPVICENVQIGLVTAGFGCGTGTPSLYTRVDKYLSFIYGISIRSNQAVTKIQLILFLTCLILST